MCINILYWRFSFWLTSLCIISSSFIHLIRTDSNVFFFNLVQSFSHVWFFTTPWTQAHLSITNSWSPPKPMFSESVMPSNHLILCHPLLLPSIFPSIRVFSNELALCIRRPKYWSFSFSISPSNEYSGLISFRTEESSPTPQFKSINSAAISFLYTSTLTSIHGYWKNHSFD